jgi:hypothetical protein
MRKLWLFVVLTFAASMALADLTYTFKSTGWQDKGKEKTIQTGSAYLKEPSFFRIDYKESNNPMMGPDTWMFSKDLKTMTFVNPKEKTYSVMDMEALMKSMGGMMDTMIKMEVENPKAAVTRGTQDQAVAGYPCKHYVMDSSYTMKMKVLFMKTTAQVNSHRDIWAADSFPLMLKDYFQNSAIRSGYKELDKVIEVEAIKVPGYILKTKSTTENKSDKGEVTKSYNEFEILTISPGGVSASLFEVPAGYKEVSLMEGMMQGSDEKDEQKDKGGKEEKEEENPLKSIFGK